MLFTYGDSFFWLQHTKKGQSAVSLLVETDSINSHKILWLAHDYPTISKPVWSCATAGGPGAVHKGPRGERHWMIRDECLRIIFPLYPLEIYHNYWSWRFNSWFSHQKWWCSIAMWVFTRGYPVKSHKKYDDTDTTQAIWSLSPSAKCFTLPQFRWHLRGVRASHHSSDP